MFSYHNARESQKNNFVSENKLTTPGDNTKISGVRVDESSTTDAMSNTGGSTNLNFEIKMASYQFQCVKSHLSILHGRDVHGWNCSCSVVETTEKCDKTRHIMHSVKNWEL